MCVIGKNAIMFVSSHAKIMENRNFRAVRQNPIIRKSPPVRDTTPVRKSPYTRGIPHIRKIPFILNRSHNR
jgi:hypothetical protein